MSELWFVGAAADGEARALASPSHGQGQDQKRRRVGRPIVSAGPKVGRADAPTFAPARGSRALLQISAMGFPDGPSFE